MANMFIVTFDFIDDDDDLPYTEQFYSFSEVIGVCDDISKVKDLLRIYILDGFHDPRVRDIHSFLWSDDGLFSWCRVSSTERCRVFVRPVKLNDGIMKIF